MNASTSLGSVGSPAKEKGSSSSADSGEQPCGYLSGFAIDFDDVIDRDEFPPGNRAHGALHDLGNSEEPETAVKEGFDSNLVGSVQHGRRRSPLATGAKGEIDRRECVAVRFLECQVETRKTETLHRRRCTIRGGERKLNGDPHVRVPDMTLPRAIDELDG